jgi:hypothetical protein
MTLTRLRAVKKLGATIDRTMNRAMRPMKLPALPPK